MPGNPATTPRFLIPRYAGSDAADFPTQVNAVVDRIDLVGGLRQDIESRWYSEVLTGEATTSQTFTNLTTPGPSSPAIANTGIGNVNGIVMVMATVQMTSASAGGEVHLIQQDGSGDTDLGILIKASGPLNGTWYSRTFDDTPAGTTNRARTGWWTFPQPSTGGAKTYTLKYASVSGTSQPATFLNRRLWVRFIPFY